jgi:hypothetical protein
MNRSNNEIFLTMETFFKFKSTRDSGCLKLVFFAGELKQKPIKYWANVGNIPPHSKLTNLIKLLKKQTDIRWGNNITHLAYYSGARLLFPYHIQWMKNSFEFELFSVFGEGRPRLYFTRKVNSNNERFTDDEIKQMNKFMETEYHLIWDSSLMVRKFMNNEKGHNEIRKTLKTIETHISNGFAKNEEGGKENI